MEILHCRTQASFAKKGLLSLLMPSRVDGSLCHLQGSSWWLKRQIGSIFAGIWSEHQTIFESTT